MEILSKNSRKYFDALDQLLDKLLKLNPKYIEGKIPQGFVSRRNKTFVITIPFSFFFLFSMLSLILPWL